MWTKRQLITQAYNELGMADYVYSLSDDELNSSLKRLDSMMAQWDGLNIRLGYLLPTNPDESSLDQASGVPDWSVEGIYMNLAIRIAPSVGKQILPDTKTLAGTTFKTIKQKLVDNIPVRAIPPSLPIGAGYKRPLRAFGTSVEESDILLGGDGELEF